MSVLQWEKMRITGNYSKSAKFLDDPERRDPTAHLYRHKNYEDQLYTTTVYLKTLTKGFKRKTERFHFKINSATLLS